MAAENTTPTPHMELSGSRLLTSWLMEEGVSIAFTTYQAGKLFLIGMKEEGSLSVFERTFNRCMGMATTPSGFYMSSLYQLWRFENALPAGQLHNGYDRLYVPQLGTTTGDIDLHDIGVLQDGSPIFINTLFSCIAAPSDIHSFKPLWKPPFIDKLAAEDRCHLNGLAMRDGKPAYVTAVSTSNVADGWRDHRRDGGVVIDVERNALVATGLSMPHSPRWYNDRLWVLNSGRGEFGYIDLSSEKFVPVAFCPGYMRGLSFVGNYALVGLSQPRHNKTFSGLALDERLQSENVEPRCGIYIINLTSGDVVHWLRIEGIVEEIYDVVSLPRVKRPMALGFKSDEIRRMITMDGDISDSPASAIRKVI